MRGCGCRAGAQNTGDDSVQKPSGWQPDCPVSVVTELGAGAAVSESSGDSQCGVLAGLPRGRQGSPRDRQGTSQDRMPKGRKRRKEKTMPTTEGRV